MLVIYWGRIHRGARALGLSFDDFPGCVTSECHPMTLRENASGCLQFHINGLINNGLTVPKPTGVSLPFYESNEFIGFLPVMVEVPETFVKEWSK